MAYHYNKFCQKIAEEFLSKETIDLAGRVLALEDDKNIESVKWDIGIIGYEILRINAVVKIARPFNNKQELQDYLRKHHLPTEYAYQAEDVHRQTYYCLEHLIEKDNIVLEISFLPPDFKQAR